MFCTNKSAVDYQFFDSVNAIPKDDWQKISTNNLFLSPNYLASLEQSMANAMDFKYVVFYHEKTPVAIAYAQIISFNTKDLALEKSANRLRELIKNALFSNLQVKVLVCGNLFACGEHGFMYDSSLITSEVAFQSLYQAFLDLQKASEKQASFLLLKEFWPNAFESSEALAKNDFKSFMIDANMVVPIDENWNTFDDYLEAMRTKFRTRAKSVFKKSAAIEVKNLSLAEIEAHLNDIERLYLNVMKNASFKMNHLKKEAFYQFKKDMPEQFFVKGYFLDNEMIGMSTAFILDDAYEATTVGLDYEFTKTHSLYQRMMYDFVQEAIKNKKSSLRLGRTAETLKSAIGAEPINMKLYLRHRNKLSNQFIKPFLDRVKPTEFEQRNPFRKGEKIEKKRA